jgi:hypothetical protein
MRVVINEAQVERNRKISHALFFISLAGMGIGFFYTWTQPADSSQISCLILPVLLFMTLTSVRMANNWIREPRPVQVLAESLKGLGKKYTIFHYLLPAQHVLIGPEGVFVIVTVWQDRAYRVEGAKWRGDEGLLRRLNGFMRQDLIGNPFAEAQFQAQQMQKLVDKVAPDRGIEVQPLVVFINPAGSFEAEEPAFPVLYADSKKEPSLRGYLRRQKDADRETLTLDDIDRIDEMYGLVTRQQLAEWESAPFITSGDDADEPTDEEAVPPGDEDEADDDEQGELGTVYILQAGQLYHIGATTEPVESWIESLQDEVSQPIEVVHTIETTDAEALEAFLHKKYARKRQKGDWFGLGKKDVAWLKSRKGEMN